MEAYTQTGFREGPVPEMRIDTAPSGSSVDFA